MRGRMFGRLNRLVPREGIEPSWPCDRQILSLLRIPVPPPGPPRPPRPSRPRCRAPAKAALSRENRGLSPIFIFRDLEPMTAVRNLLFVMCDQLRRDFVSCYGDTCVESPNIDRLA